MYDLKKYEKGVYVIARWIISECSLKQLLKMSSRSFLKPSIDTFGADRRIFCTKARFSMFYMDYMADINQFACAVPICQRHANFLFIGRLVSLKGVEELAGAYLAYREQVSKPWGLKVAGSGPLENLLRRIPGVDLLGFVQPTAVRELMRDARCFVLPSRWEPWGVVIHEAAAAGLPIIATYSCGATTMFVGTGKWVCSASTRAIFNQGNGSDVRHAANDTGSYASLPAPL
jgi:glycosyltransferase involved in cell wall biosynthesis